jgi:hypothetical protein
MRDGTWAEVQAGRVQEQVEQLRAIMEAVADRATFLSTSGDPADQPIEKEEEEAVLERRPELFTLFRNAAKIVPETASEVVRARLQQIMADPGTPFQVSPPGPLGPAPRGSSGGAYRWVCCGL